MYFFNFKTYNLEYHVNPDICMTALIVSLSPHCIWFTHKAR